MASLTTETCENCDITYFFQCGSGDCVVDLSPVDEGPDVSMFVFPGELYNGYTITFLKPIPIWQDQGLEYHGFSNSTGEEYFGGFDEVIFAQNPCYIKYVWWDGQFLQLKH